MSRSPVPAAPAPLPAGSGGAEAAVGRYRRPPRLREMAARWERVTGGRWPSREAMIDRASSADAAMLAMYGTAPVPRQMGALLLLETKPGFDVADARELIARRIRRVPRLRRCLTRVPPGCGLPVWVDDAAFDVTAHVRAIRCPPPGDERALLDLATRVVTTPLPRTRPAWRAVFVTGLADGATAMIVVLDHVLADGLGGLAVLANLVDGAGAPAPEEAVAGEKRAGGAAGTSPAGAAAGGTEGFPGPPPGVRGLAADAWRAKLGVMRRLPRLWSDLREATAAAGGVRAVRAQRCSLTGRTGTEHRMVPVRTGLAAFHAAAHRHGGTVNDALLTVITGALGRLLAGRGEHVGSIAVVVPVAVRRATADTRLGNEITPLVAALPVAGDPRDRVGEVALAMRARKALAGRMPALSLGGVPFRAAARLGLYRLFMDHQRRMHTLISNVRGPDAPLSFGGAPIRSAIPLSVGDSGNMAVSFDALSYAGTLTVVAVADPALVPDLDVLLTGLREQLVKLTAGSARPVVGRAPA